MSTQLLGNCLGELLNGWKDGVEAELGGRGGGPGMCMADKVLGCK